MNISQRVIKKQILTLLNQPDNLTSIISELDKFPPRKLLNALFAGICSGEEIIRWHSITVMGVTVAKIADQEMEAARIIIRRLMWSLNDESGGIGWGAPEAMAECLSCHAALAKEYTHMLVSFMREDGYFLEYPPIQRGLMWGLGRLSQVRSNLLLKKQVALYLPTYLKSDDITVRALAAKALGTLKITKTAKMIHELTNNDTIISLYQNRVFTMMRVADIARQALLDMKAIGEELTGTDLKN